MGRQRDVCFWQILFKNVQRNGTKSLKHPHFDRLAPISCFFFSQNQSNEVPVKNLYGYFEQKNFFVRNLFLSDVILANLTQIGVKWANLTHLTNAMTYLIKVINRNPDQKTVSDILSQMTSMVVILTIFRPNSKFCVDVMTISALITKIILNNIPIRISIHDFGQKFT